jgi:hypothetical protein
MTETQYAERVSDIDQRIAAIDVKLTSLEAARRAHSLDALAGSRAALQSIAAGDAETDKLNREKRTLAAALEELNAQMLLEAAGRRQRSERAPHPRRSPLTQARAHDGRRRDGGERAGQGLRVYGAPTGRRDPITSSNRPQAAPGSYISPLNHRVCEPRAALRPR